MKIYISGPMRGLPEFNYPAFNEAAEKIRENNHTPLNPADSFGGATDRPFSDYMRADYEMLLEADCIAFLPGWQNSEGARLEYGVAKSLGLTVVNLEHLGTNFPFDLSITEPVEMEAARIVRNGEREAAYGHPGKDFARTAAMWSGLTGQKVTPEQVALMMIQLKISRLIATPDHRDSVVDLIGYAICYARIVLEGNYA